MKINLRAVALAVILTAASLVGLRAAVGPDGSASAPALYGTDIPSGIYFEPSVNGTSVSVNGTKVGGFLTTGWNGNVVGNVTGNISGALVCSGSSPVTIGCYAPAANTLGLSARTLPFLYGTNPASAVNYATLTGSIASSPLILGAAGTDTDVGIVLQPKGAGVVSIGGTTSVNGSFQAATVASAVNQIKAIGGATGTAPSLVVGGSSADANRNIVVQGNGTGIVVLGQTICTISGTTPQTCNGQRGIVTTGTLTTAAATATTYQINNSSIATTSLVVCTLQHYSGTYVTNGYPIITECNPGSGSVVVGVVNTHAANALSGTLAIGFAVLN